MADRWRKPVIPKTVEHENGSLIHLDGQVRQDVRLILAQEDVDRIRLGYVCLKCLEPHPTPFPKTCSLCGYAMSTNQGDDFARDYGGETKLGPSTSNDDEIERMREDKARERHVPGSSIIVPSWAKL